MKKTFEQLIKEKIVILDGATGTNLQKRGMPAGVCPEQWIIEHPEVLAQLQKEYAAAGSDIVYAPTFSGNSIKLAEYGLEDQVEEMNCRLVQISREAVGEDVLIAGDMTMTGQQLAPMGTLTFTQLQTCYEQQAKALANAGVDLFVVETMMSLQETRAAVLAIKNVCDIPIMVTMTFDETGHTLYGTDDITALIVLQSLGIVAFGMNCSCGPERMAPMIESMKRYAQIPLIAKANAGLPQYVDGTTVFSMDPESFARENATLLRLGASIVGGCCGTTPEHIRALALEAQGLKPQVPEDGNGLSDTLLTTERKFWSLDRNFANICFNTTLNVQNDSEFCQDLADGCWDTLYDLMEDIAEEEPDVIVLYIDDIHIEGCEVMSHIFDEMDLNIAPVAIASSNMTTIESGLKHYPGRLLVIDLSDDDQSREAIKLMSQKYGAVYTHKSNLNIGAFND